MNLSVVRAWAVILLISGALIGYYVYSTTHTGQGRQFVYGLDLVGGSQLVYEADTSNIDPSNVNDAMSALRDVIERRVNTFGVSEPLVQVEKASSLSSSDKTERLIVELPGITDLNQAIAMIGKTPLLEFKLVGPPVGSSTEPTYIETGLTGRYLARAVPKLPNASGGAGFSTDSSVDVTFNDEGKALFAKITRENVGKQLAIFLDGDLKSDPVIREPILGGTAVISGGFTKTEVQELARNLNIGALPVPIQLASTESVGASLGMETLHKSEKAGIIGLTIVAVFMLLWYRLPGLVASVALMIYVILMLALFKLMPVTITAAGLAGFILSMGMAVDANVLIFERTKEELRAGKLINEAVHEGFARAWLSIRDGNATNIIAAIVLFWFGTAIVKGFALVYGLGLIVHMFTAITITRTVLLSFGNMGNTRLARNLLSSGFSKL
jgi:protein-export membrane protein SecD